MQEPGEGNTFVFQNFMHLKQPSFATTGSKEEFNRNDYSNYHLPEVCPRKEQDPSSARTHALPQGKEASGCVVAPCPSAPTGHSGPYSPDHRSTVAWSRASG